jgi:hypothetical protein
MHMPFAISMSITSPKIASYGIGMSLTSPMNSSRKMWTTLMGLFEIKFAELQLYSMRHVQEIAAQLSLMLGQKVGSAPDYVTTARNRAS